MPCESGCWAIGWVVFSWRRWRELLGQTPAYLQLPHIQPDGEVVQIPVAAEEPMSNANFSKKILCSWHLFLLPILFEPRTLGMKGKSCILPLLLSFWKVNLLFKHEFFLFFSNNKLKKAFQHLMTQLFSLESYPNITGLAPDLLVPSFQIAKTDCMCFYMLGLNDFRTVLCDKLTGINKYCNIWNGTKPWVTELASFLFFRFLFLFFVTCFEFGDKKKKKRPIFRAEW